MSKSTAVPGSFTRYTAVQQLSRPQALAGAAVLAALHLILNQLTIPVSPYLQIGFDFLTMAVTGMLYGPWVAGMSGVITDLLGYMLRPNGPYFPGWTLSAFLIGMLYGLIFYNRPVTLRRVIVARLLMVVIFNFFLTPLWLSMLYGKAFVLMSSMRFIKNVIKFPIDVALLLAVLNLADREVRRRMQ